MMFTWLRRRKAKEDFDVYVRVWLQNNNELVELMLAETTPHSPYKLVIEEIVQGASNADKSFMFVSIYISARILPSAELEDLIIFQECIDEKTYENIPYIFWIIFHFLFCGVVAHKKGELSAESLVFGREKLIEFFVNRGTIHNVVLDYFADGLAEYHTIARETLAIVKTG